METSGVAARFFSELTEKHSFSANRAAKPQIFNAKDIRNDALHDRARVSHRHLINLTAERISAAGGIPKSNDLIDLAVNLDSDFIFEMKSTTDANVRSQVRKGISQLYEYRYLQNKPEANLVLVVERPINAPNQWMNEYLENDRGVLLVWDGDDRLFGSPQASNALPFLNLNRH